jgi:hypothetical protein
MPKPSLQNRSHFKTWLRYYKDKFTSNIQVAPEFYIDDILTSKASGISTTDNVSILIVDNRENISITTAFNNDDLIYIPALSGDTITVGIGTSSLALKFGDEGSAITYDGVSYGLNDSIPISSTRVATVKGLGGLLIQGGNTPTYTVGVSTTVIDEGQSVDFTINTTDVAAGATLYFNSTTSMLASDFSDNSLTGSVSVVSTGATTGVATITRTVANDFLNEGQENFFLTIRTNSVTGPVVQSSPTVTVNDVVSTYALTSSALAINEGNTLTVTVSGSNIPNGTYYWTIHQEEGTVTASDFNPASFNGTVTVNSNSGSFNVVLVSDRLTEGEEKIVIRLRKDSITGEELAFTPVIVVNDTSRNVGEAANGLTFGPIQVNRDNGDATQATDWYKICNLDSIPDGSSIALFIDGSGSMKQANVQASYELLVSKLNARGITITTVTNSNEDWITPFLVDLP